MPITLEDTQRFLKTLYRVVLNNIDNLEPRSELTVHTKLAMDCALHVGSNVSKYKANRPNWNVEHRQPVLGDHQATTLVLNTVLASSSQDCRKALLGFLVNVFPVLVSVQTGAVRIHSPINVQQSHVDQIIDVKIAPALFNSEIMMTWANRHGGWNEAYWNDSQKILAQCSDSFFNGLTRLLRSADKSLTGEEKPELPSP